MASGTPNGSDIPATRQMVVWDCVVEDMAVAMFPPGYNNQSANPAFNQWGYFVFNSDILGWQNYGMYAPNSFGRICVRGCRVNQEVLADQNGSNDKNNDAYNRHGPIRVAGPGQFILDQCDMFSTNGWSSGQGVPNHQPCVRCQTTGQDGGYNQMTRNMFEGGWNVVQFGVYGGGGNTPSVGYWGRINMVFEKNIVLTSASCQAAIGFEAPAWVMRNNIIIVSNAKPMGNGVRTMVDGKPGSPSAWNNLISDTAAQEVYCNTFIDLRNDTNLGSRTIQIDNNVSNYPAYSEANNILHAPNATGGPTVGLAAAEITGIDGNPITPLFAGFKAVLYSKPTMDTSFATPSDSVRVWTPTGGSSAEDSATGTLIPIDDFYGTIRNGTTNKGAVET
jgi:hypothetical protein